MRKKALEMRQKASKGVEEEPAKVKIPPAPETTANLFFDLWVNCGHGRSRWGGGGGEAPLARVRGGGGGGGGVAALRAGHVIVGRSLR